jgi:CHAD domain-containing protein/HD superfamily phosphodiesterase
MKSTSQPTGLGYWMERVLEECDNVAADFSADPVHDLRVSLRRCRSMADGMMAMDPDKDWKSMKKAGKQLFQRLGALRDVQIMMEWIEKLELGSGKTESDSSSLAAGVGRNDIVEGINVSAESLSDVVGNGNAEPPAATELGHDPAGHALLHILRAREAGHKHEARAALEGFDRKQWRQWSKTLPQRAAKIRPGSAVFRHLALERWTEARQLHVTAMRNRSQVALHTLRIGIKRFRYIVENFLPEEHKLWSDDLKDMQDLLGEVHDLDVLWATAVSCHVFSDEEARKAWHTRIVEERTKRVDAYRARTIGANSLWNVWRVGLPQGKQIQEIATRRMKLWAKALDPDFAHSERVARLALELYDGLAARGLLERPSNSSTNENAGRDARESLYAAALLHDVGKAEGDKGHHKQSLELIKKHGTPLGWKADNMARAAIVARFHCGALPTRGHKALRDLLADEQKRVIRLSAILRLANALDSTHDGHVRKVKIENGNAARRRTNGFLRKPTPLGKNEALVIEAEGYREGSPTGQAVAAERYLLETVLRRAVVVKASFGSRRPTSGPLRSADTKL